VGILDSYFPECEFFTEFERFGRHINKIGGVDYAVICSPNHLHDYHCIAAMKAGCNVICEKPLCLTERNLDAIQRVEQSTGKSVNVILQLRLHPNIETFAPKTGDKVELFYVTPRGRWYAHTWKGDVSKSGGLATNIGVHLFDLIALLYGPAKSVIVSWNLNDCAAGLLDLESGKAEWILSISRMARAERLLSVNDKKFINLTTGFENLHTKSYEKILSGLGFGTETARESIRICEKIRESTRQCI
jgi:UDP-N-acetyl-2-amino-2-deoxyglucuronate dehydrogenase